MNPRWGPRHEGRGMRMLLRMLVLEKDQQAAVISGYELARD